MGYPTLNASRTKNKKMQAIEHLAQVEYRINTMSAEHSNVKGISGRSIW